MKSTILTLPVVLASSFALSFFSQAFGAGAIISTPIEKNNYGRITRSAEISEFLDELDRNSLLVRKELLGHSVQGRPLEALFLAEQPYLKTASPTPDRLTFLLIGSQHGTEPSGAEALLSIARDLVWGQLKRILADADVILIPNANPDGRETRRRANANGVNLSTDFVLLSQPESQALNNVLVHCQPEAVLDVHESAVLKKKSLGREGYLTDFEAQFEVANNPNVDSEIRTMSLNDLLPEIIACVQSRGLSAQRYIGEITSTRQAITNGGLSIRNIRNKAGVLGAFAFLVENRLDPSNGNYPTPRNIRSRVAKQVISIQSWLEVVHAAREQVVTVSKQARVPRADSRVWLHATYVRDAAHPQTEIQLRKRQTGEAVRMSFPDYRAVEPQYSIKLPVAYIVTFQQKALSLVLGRHGIPYQVVNNTFTRKALAQSLVADKPQNEHKEKKRLADPAVLSERHIALICHPGDLWIDVVQPFGKLAVLLLEPRSSSSLFRAPPYSETLKPGKEFFVYRVGGERRTRFH